MPSIKSVVVACDMVTSYGQGVNLCWKRLMAGESAIGEITRFDTRHFKTNRAGIIPGLSCGSGESIIMKMLAPMFKDKRALIPEDSFPILATTTGEIGYLEGHIITGKGEYKQSDPGFLLEKIVKLTGAKYPGLLVSAACTSSNTAVAHGAALINSGRYDSVLVIACDSVSEFVFSGFSAIMALDENTARPFDKNRKGLTLGEAAGFILMMSPERALREKRPVFGKIAGWGLTSDANHMTGPAKDGRGLAAAIHNALQSASVTIDDVGVISAHGTGTIYNDAMEMQAFKKIFNKQPVPAYSIKGGTGHTMGAAGLLEIIIALKSLQEMTAPPTVNLLDADQQADGWVFSEPINFKKPVTLSTNSGFGGVNGAIVLC